MHMLGLLQQLVAGCTSPVVPGCNITAGAARCTSDHIPTLVHALPSCLLQLHIYTSNGYLGHWSNTDFSQLPNLEELIVEATPDHRFKCLNLGSFEGLASLRILRIKHKQCSYTSKTFSPLHNIEILDFSRTYSMSLRNAQNILSLLHANPIRRLVLKAVQSLNDLYEYTDQINLSNMLCPFGETLEYVDLSFNDIQSIQLNGKDLNCLKHLKYLDLQFNMIKNRAIEANGIFHLL